MANATGPKGPASFVEQHLEAREDTLGPPKWQQMPTFRQLTHSPHSQQLLNSVGGAVPGATSDPRTDHALTDGSAGSGLGGQSQGLVRGFTDTPTT